MIPQPHVIPRLLGHGRMRAVGTVLWFMHGHPPAPVPRCYVKFYLRLVRS